MVYLFFSQHLDILAGVFLGGGGFRDPLSQAMSFWAEAYVSSDNT